VAGHFECIGIAAEDEFHAVLEAAVEGGEESELDGARELVWRDSDGASVAVTVLPDGAVQCARPSFAAAPRVPVRVGAIAEDPECAFCSRLLVEVVDDEGELAYPLAVELERHGPAHDPRARGRISRMAISAFAETLETWPSEPAYSAAKSTETAGDVPLAPRSLIPTGLFVEEPKQGLLRRKAPEPVPTAHALVTGAVRDTRRRRNSVTGREFAWFELETFGASFDVLAPAEVDGLERGAIVQGGFWLIGAVPERGGR
jgi:hypothetical protein